MLVAPVASAVASAVLLTVVSQCARNMIETVQVQKLAIADASSSNSDKLLRNPLESLPAETGTGLADRIRTMKRRDLLHLFASSRAPTSSELSEWFSSKDHTSDTTNDEYSEWDAMLLDNNKGATTYATAFITHNLFGGISLPWRLLGESSLAKGRWNGKAFAKPTTTTSGRGTNRFAGRDAKLNPRNFLRHDFDYTVVSSKILPGDALRLDYSPYQSLPISLWSSMRDEVRVVEASLESNDGDDVVLIGMGWMGWSGGSLNCSPFLLERSRK